MATPVLSKSPQQSSERPFWLTSPCPPWCSGDHHPGDRDDERVHRRDLGTIQLTLHDAWGVLKEPQPLHITLTQGYREAAPRVEVYAPVPDVLLLFSLDEARQLADAVNAAFKTKETTR